MLRFTTVVKNKHYAAGGIAISTVYFQNIASSNLHNPLPHITSAESKVVPPSRDFSSNTSNTSSTTPKRTTTLPNRQEQIKTLSNSKNQIFDVLVIGGGATGAGAALDAQTRGLNTALIERGDFGNETSARSTKLIWAGIRYIATAFSSLLRVKNIGRPIDAMSDFASEFHMVKNCHKERKLLLENNPHLTNWIPIAVPFDSWISWPAPFGHTIFAIAPMIMPLVFKFYDGMSGFTCPPSHIMGKARAERKFPQLASENAKYYSVFYEGQHDDARTATYLALTAAEYGACVTNYTEMISILYDENGKANGITCRDKISGQEFDVHCKSLVFAGGPFTDHMRKIENPDCKPAVAAAAGTHIVLPGYYCAKGIGMLDINTSDGRFLFFLPWQGKTVVGTTDRKGPVVSDYAPPEEEISWLLNECQKYLKKNGGGEEEGSSGIEVKRTDVLSAWQGFRPLASDPNAPPDAPVSRDHVLSENPDTGIIFITGGKWTTYREMAQDVMDKVVKRFGFTSAGPCITHEISLRGGVGYSRNIPIKLVQDFGVSMEVAEHLARTYGIHAFDVLKEGSNSDEPRGGKTLIAGYPYLEREIEYACKHEMADSVTDMLTVRTRLAYLDSAAALMVIPRVTDIMASSLGWSKQRKKQELVEAEKIIGSFGGPVPSQVKTVDSIHSIEDLFNSFDVNKTGFIDYDELRLCMKYYGLPFKNEREAMAAFKSIDKNGDGKVGFDEFMLWWKRKKLRRLQTRNPAMTDSDTFKLSTEKLGEGADSRGAAFG